MEPFTSGLSVAEVALLRESGFQPLQQVMGTCVYYVGFIPTWRSSVKSATYTSMWPGYPNAAYIEIGPLTDAWNEARGLAISRLRSEARVTRSAYDWKSGLMEFRVVGTAVRSTRFQIDSAVVTNLSGQELSQLIRNGYWPVGLIAETTVTNVLPGYRTSAVYTPPLSLPHLHPTDHQPRRALENAGGYSRVAFPLIPKHQDGRRRLARGRCEVRIQPA